MTFQEEIIKTVNNEISIPKIKSYLKNLINTCNISIDGDIEASSRYSKTIFKRNNETAIICNSIFDTNMMYDFRIILQNKLKEQK